MSYWNVNRIEKLLLKWLPKCINSSITALNHTKINPTQLLTIVNYIFIINYTYPLFKIVLYESKIVPSVKDLFATAKLWSKKLIEVAPESPQKGFQIVIALWLAVIYQSYKSWSSIWKPVIENELANIKLASFRDWNSIQTKRYWWKYFLGFVRKRFTMLWVCISMVQWIILLWPSKSCRS